MPTFRDFGTPEVPKEGPTFKLCGETFTCLPEAPAAVLDDLVSGVSQDGEGNRVYNAPSLIRFVCGVLRDTMTVTVAEALADGHHKAEWDVLSDEDREVELVDVPADDVRRFQRIVRSKTTIVPIDTLGEIVMWLSEELAGRPTVPSGRSGPGRR